jgi:hypothetical protein
LFAHQPNSSLRSTSNAFGLAGRNRGVRPKEVIAAVVTIRGVYAACRARALSSNFGGSLGIVRRFYSFTTAVRGCGRAVACAGRRCGAGGQSLKERREKQM